ncbi:UDP-glucose 4-epimerase [Sulfitobacter noctilucicola]|uniref:UDP-glucose 4-epimerase n=1 Tax=Sulfitobacter noctilucicola TaxID=1342301 RepID=A0A7W6M9B8_9RHOB|nr:UDP-glucose 4-epimerase GalE [Sulfitobacter noctilucicola]KIN64988.1 UDP-glucose 4-epimerase [Sulfitobacter noctilucicola]MBB4173871.1 UDP-glucose 4-epimerase [Sulfitobacter noctilucicola]
MPACIMLTGGAGFIGSHTYLALVRAGYQVVIVDDFSNAARSVPDRLARITQRPVTCYDVNVSDPKALGAVFETHAIDAVVHFAARKSVPQSLAQPQGFFDANITALLGLMKVMEQHEVSRIVYSSSATVYGAPEALPIPEHAPLTYTNPYGLSKLLGEQFLNQKSRTSRARGLPKWAVGVLRYFNPAGADASGLIGEAPLSNGGNLMPLVAKVAKGQLPFVQIFGRDYGTHDGTGIRDFIHVSDLAEGHVQSLALLLGQGRSHTVNLGKGQGYSVLDVIKTYEAVSGQAIPYRFKPRREGDVAASFADPTMAASVLGFSANRNLLEMCQSSWRWESTAEALWQPPKISTRVGNQGHVDRYAGPDLLGIV